MTAGWQPSLVAVSDRSVGTSRVATGIPSKPGPFRTVGVVHPLAADLREAAVVGLERKFTTSRESQPREGPHPGVQDHPRGRAPSPRFALGGCLSSAVASNGLGRWPRRPSLVANCAAIGTHGTWSSRAGRGYLPPQALGISRERPQTPREAGLGRPSGCRRSVRRTSEGRRLHLACAPRPLQGCGHDRHCRHPQYACDGHVCRRLSGHESPSAES